MIHSTAIIHSSVKLGKNVSIGAFCLIDANVSIDDGTVLESHVVVKGKTSIGKGNHIYQFASVGEDCQDKKYAGEPTELIIGDNNIIRESVTIHRGTIQDKSVTKIGSNNLLMCFVHIAHDCVIGDNSIFATGATLAGHVHIGDWVIMGGLTAAHQFCHIGAHSFIGGGTIILADVPPYIMVGNNGEPRGINSEGLKRRGFSSETIAQIKRGYKILYRNNYRAIEAVEKLKELSGETQEITLMADFVSRSSRGIVR